MKASSGKQQTVSNHNGSRAPRNVSAPRSMSASPVLIARRTRFVRRFVNALILLSFLGLAHALPVGAQSRVPVPSYGPMRDAGAAQQTGLPPALLNVRIDQKLDASIPLDATFRDETGRSRRLQEYFGGRKPVILSLVFYECPMLCNQVLNGLTATMKVMPLKIGEDYDVLTVSFDPRETPELAARKKQSYVQRLQRPGATAGWHFLTGDEANIKQLTEAVGFRYGYDAQTNQFAHASGIMLLTPTGKISHYFYGVEYGPRDVRLGLVEASAGRIGSPVDQLLLYCYHYDPSTGKYSWVINIYRWGGAITVAAMIALLLVLRRRGPASASAAAAGAHLNQGGTA